ncbi:hypothetical protein ALC60_09780 [Trachymyrmex zeteki]|uniref:Uncharacterized protein n=1 Tax=Mycetomoellerius zeteki TaxID=64791 RepID=A0A151WT85_9HYME|nr:hypothetical protein ALC60_09780 [Trachymyrmex zeteki]
MVAADTGWDTYTRRDTRMATWRLKEERAKKRRKERARERKKEKRRERIPTGSSLGSCNWKCNFDAEYTRKSPRKLKERLQPRELLRVAFTLGERQRSGCWGVVENRGKRG